MDKIGRNLKKHRNDAKLTQQNVADALGVNRVSVTQWESGDAKPSVARIAELAELYGVKVDDLVMSEDKEEGALPFVAVGDVKKASVDVPKMHSMPKDVPVLGTAACNHTEGSFQIESSVIEYVRRPVGLTTAKDIYALYVEGDSMEPKFSAGDLVFVHPRRPARINDAVVVQFLKKEGDYPQAMIGVYEKRTAEFVELKKYNPPAIIKIPSNTVQIIHRLVTNNELYGV